MKKLKFNDSFKTETKNSNESLVKVVRGREALLVYLWIISTYMVRTLGLVCRIVCDEDGRQLGLVRGRRPGRWRRIDHDLNTSATNTHFQSLPMQMTKQNIPF